LKGFDMQQELIEMLEEIIQYWHPEDWEALDRAEALIEKAKNNAPVVPQGFKPVGYLRSDEFDGHRFEPINGEWPLGELLFSATPALRAKENKL
jgi:hypothetical protein